MTLWTYFINKQDWFWLSLFYITAIFFPFLFFPLSWLYRARLPACQLWIFSNCNYLVQSLDFKCFDWLMYILVSFDDEACIFQKLITSCQLSIQSILCSFRKFLNGVIENQQIPIFYFQSFILKKNLLFKSTIDFICLYWYVTYSNLYRTYEMKRNPS